MFLSLSYLAHSNYRLSLGFTNDGFLLLRLLLCQSINVKLNVIRIYSRNKLLTLIVDETNRSFASTLVTYRKFVTLRALTRIIPILYRVFRLYRAAFLCLLHYPPSSLRCIDKRRVVAKESSFRRTVKRAVGCPYLPRRGFRDTLAMFT